MPLHWVITGVTGSNGWAPVYVDLDSDKTKPASEVRAILKSFSVHIN